MTYREKVRSQLMQLSEGEAEILSGHLSRNYAVLPDEEILYDNEGLPSGWWVGIGVLIAVTVVVTGLVCSAFCGGG